MYMDLRNTVIHIVVSPLLYLSNKQSEIRRVCEQVERYVFHVLSMRSECILQN